MDGYWHVQIGSKLYLAHRLAWFYTRGGWPRDQIDHVDGNRANNRLSNLREATHTQNMQNRKINRNNKCGFKGVARVPSNRWRARIKVSNKSIHLGTFDTRAQAGEAYAEAADKYFGKFVRVV